MANRKEIDFDMLEKLCYINCTEVEICSLLEICEDTLNLRCKEAYAMTFSEYYKKNANNGKKSLRRKQLEVALAGNPALLIWLGKNMLGQSDKIDNNQTIKMTKTPEELIDTCLEAIEAKKKSKNVIPE